MAGGFDKLVADAMTPATEARFNGHSMVGTLKRVLVCSPRAACWHQPDGPRAGGNWASLIRRISRWRRRSMRRLCRELEACGAEVEDIPPAMELSLDAGLRPRCIVAHRLWIDPDAPRQDEPRSGRQASRIFRPDPGHARCWPRLRLRRQRKPETSYGLIRRRY